VLSALKPALSKLDKSAFSIDRMDPNVSSHTRKPSFSQHLAPPGIGVSILIVAVWGWSVREERHVTASEGIVFLDSNTSLACVLLIAASISLACALLAAASISLACVLLVAESISLACILLVAASISLACVFLVAASISLACVLLVEASGTLGSYARIMKRAMSFQLYERLFTPWHTFNLPFCLLLFAAAAVYVLAVHLY
jgi:hypothetical protein